MITIDTDPILVSNIFSKTVHISETDLSVKPYPHIGFILKSSDSSALCMLDADCNIFPIKNPPQIKHIKPLAAEQSVFIKQLLNKDIPLNIATGAAGTGKSLLAISAALNLVLHQESPYNQVLFIKPLSEVGSHRMGSVPGNVREKLAPYISSFMDSIELYLDDPTGRELALLEAKQVIQFHPINYLRGRSIRNSIIVIDEAQNISLDEMKTICTRIGANSKMFMLGDIRQSDEKHSASGLKKLLSSTDLHESSLVSFQNLEKNHRSPLSALLDKVLHS